MLDDEPEAPEGQPEAEKDRAAAAQQAEIARAAEVQKNLEAAEKESRLREAELVLPRYVDLLEAVHATLSVTSRCADAINANLSGASDWGGIGVGTAASVEPGGPVKTFIGPEVVESCSKVDATIDPLELRTPRQSCSAAFFVRNRSARVSMTCRAMSGSSRSSARMFHDVSP